ncbi:MAG: cysteine desulfurase family protein [Janthinobacterium lividum]
MIYLDANATEPLRPGARAAVIDALGLVGNPSSIHGPGRAARQMLESSRRVIGSRYGAPVGGVVFTSGGTEADALAVASLGWGRRVLIGATEHDAVRAASEQAEAVPVDRDGVIDLSALERSLMAGPPALVCVMLANNETGTVQPIVDVAALCRRFGALLHVDAVPAAGRMVVDLAALGADSLAVSGHKIGGPKGAGALLLADDGHLAPLIAGGGQERGRRGGTPALPAIAGFAAAAQCPLPDLLPLRDSAERAAVSAGAIVLGGSNRLANTSCLALPGVRAETQVIALDLAGIAVSAGAACSSGKVSRSHVLDAMGCGTLAGEAIRVSLPWNATAEDVAAFEVAYRAMVTRLGRLVGAS